MRSEGEDEDSSEGGDEDEDGDGDGAKDEGEDEEGAEEREGSEGEERGASSEDEGISLPVDSEGELDSAGARSDADESERSSDGESDYDADGSEHGHEEDGREHGHEDARADDDTRARARVALVSDARQRNVAISRAGPLVRRLDPVLHCFGAKVGPRVHCIRLGRGVGPRGARSVYTSVWGGLRFCAPPSPPPLDLILLFLCYNPDSTKMT